MKIVCEKEKLLKGINSVINGVASKTTMPVLEGILIQTNDKEVKLTTYDLEIGIEYIIECDVKEQGNTVVNATMFSEIIRKLPNTDIAISVNDKNLLVIECEGSLYKLATMNPSEFPELPQISIENSIQIEQNNLKDMIRKTSFAASIDESRGVITGVLIEMKERKLNMVALDGFRMAVARENIINAKEQNIIIPAKILNEISKIITENEGDMQDVDLYINEKRAVFIIEDTKVVLRLLEGEFVDYANILPKDSKCRVVVNRGDLLESIERASLLAKVGKNNLIKLDIKSSSMEVTSKSEEGNVKEEVIISKEGDDLTIGFNSKYMIDALKAIEDENITMNFNTSISPCLLKPITGESYEYLVLPVRITNN